MSRVTTPEGLKILDESSDNDLENGVTNIVYKEIFSDLRVTAVIDDAAIRRISKSNSGIHICVNKGSFTLTQKNKLQMLLQDAHHER
ncbi:hypothetical protein Bca4012_037004 [Brassica carinata]